MGSSLLPLTFVFIFSLSLAATATAFDSELESPHSISLQARPRATFSDLLSLLGTPQQARLVNPEVAQRLYSCFKFLVPFNRTIDTHRRSLSSKLAAGNEIDELVLTPPAPVYDLARLAFNSGDTRAANKAAIRGELDPAVIPVPDVEGSNEDGCNLADCSNAKRFLNGGLNSYLASLFEIIVERGPSVGLDVSLSRYDLHHGHLFVTEESRRLGILFHAKEYPAFDRKVYPFNSNCEAGSNVFYDDLIMNLRNILWLAPLPSNTPGEWLAPGVLVVLDANSDGVIYKDLIIPGSQYFRTLDEGNFGRKVLDVNYLKVGAQAPYFQIFIC